jgi:hypothetical protein
MYRIMLLNRYRRARPREAADISLLWDGTARLNTETSRPSNINGHCLDISKTYLGEVHVRAFGYGLEIDPVEFEGEAFAKGDENGTQDGHIVCLPIDAKPSGMVYQRIVDNVMPDGTRQDICIPIVGGVVPCIHLRYRTLGDVIGKAIAGRGELCSVDDILTPTEHDAVLRMCDEMCFEFGEIDAIRDRNDGRLYILDANRMTGTGIVPREMADEREYWRYMATLADAFDLAFLNPISKMGA